MSVYLDHNATTPIRPEAAEAVARALAVGGNPSAVHGFGRNARRLVDDAREQVAILVGAEPAGVIFTSGGTEANALALTGLGLGGLRILLSASMAALTRIDAQDVLIALSLAVVATILAALYPTWRAVQVQPAWQLKVQ